MLALIIGFSVVTGSISNNLEVVTSQKAYSSSTSSKSLTLEDIVLTGCKFLGAPYTLGQNGYSNAYGSAGNYKIHSDSWIWEYGFDCSGFVYYILTTLGCSTSGFSRENPVPITCGDWRSWNSSCTFTYNGTTYDIERTKSSVSYAEAEYWELEDGSTIEPGTLVIGVPDDTSISPHAWIYLGEFDSRSDVVSWLKEIGVDSSLISSLTVKDDGSGSTHWRLECGGYAASGTSGDAGIGVGINNNSTGKSMTTAYKISTYEIPVSPETGSLKITKSSEDGVISGVQFQVTGPIGKKNSTTQTVTTGSDGTVQLDELDEGYYTVTEVNTRR